MEGRRTSSKATHLPLHTSRVAQHAAANRLLAVVYACALLALLYRHALQLLHSATLFSFVTSILLSISDLVLGFMWCTTQSFRMRPLLRQVFPENLKQVAAESRKDFPALDIFICTADPYKEPPVSVVNTALSVMAYDYPTEKLSVYVSDDGGSELTLFAFLEAAKFGTHWLPFCRDNNIEERCPDAYFRSNYPASSHTEKIKMMYESMKMRVENAVERGKVWDDYITCESEREAFTKFRTEGFSRQDHPTVIQVLLEVGKNEDITGQSMPNLIYLSRQKSRTSAHHFKAGALNTLLRVSAVMTNSPIILTLDCDTFSNDPQTLHRMLCFLWDDHDVPSSSIIQPSSSSSSSRRRLGYVQFPQRFHSLNRADIYACEHKRLFQVNPVGMDGLAGPNYVGAGCFFRRRAFFGGPCPSSFVPPEIPQLGPDHPVGEPIMAQSIFDLANRVAACDYENKATAAPSWGSKMGFRYGSLVEDYNTGYRLQCEGWKAVFCDPKRPAFLGDVPISLNDALNQTKRWAVGLFEVGFSKYSPLTFGAHAMGPLMGLCYTHYSFWPIWSIPIATYALLPQLALLNNLSVFPKVWEAWFSVYAFLFLGAYGQDCVDFMLAEGTLQRWWSDQRMWLIRGLSCYLFGSVEYLTKQLGMATHGFNVTSKVVDDEQSKRYDQGYIEFGVPSPMFVPLVTAAIINLAALLVGLVHVVMADGNLNRLFVQMFLAAFGVVNCWPIYEAVLFRSDNGKMPSKTTITASFLACALYIGFSLMPEM